MKGRKYLKKNYEKVVKNNENIIFVFENLDKRGSGMRGVWAEEGVGYYEYLARNCFKIGRTQAKLCNFA